MNSISHVNRHLDCDICGYFGDNIAVYPGLWIVPLVRGRSEAFRGLAKCQAVSSEGSTVLCAMEDP